MTFRIGCCGFPVARRKYFAEFEVVELQSTFYHLPQDKTAHRWREEAPSNFEFAVKAWQAITHPLSSPTWRNVKERPSKSPDKYGMLRPIRENLDAWFATLTVCRILRAKTCLIQTPPKFGCTPRNSRNATQFFREIDRDRLNVAWEPRGDWSENPEQVSRICEKLELVHVVDPLRKSPAYNSELGYFRLHGLGGKEVNYAYKYNDEDLATLSHELSLFTEKGLERAYVMFNNISMFNDAIRFRNRHVSGTDPLPWA
jgi:uncharacterized protein YecE (DUF72 family)